MTAAAQANRTVESVAYPRLAAIIEAIIREYVEREAMRTREGSA